MSTTVLILLLLLVVLAAGEFILFGALAETYRDIRQIREAEGMIDRPTPIDLGVHAGAPATSIGLPEALNNTSETLALFVDSRCTTCRGILASLGGAIPGNVIVTAIAPSREEAVKWLIHSAGFDLDDRNAWTRIEIASPDEIRLRLGLEITPLGIVIEHGRLARAMTIPSVRSFYKQVPVGVGLPSTQPEGAIA